MQLLLASVLLTTALLLQCSLAKPLDKRQTEPAKDEEDKDYEDYTFGPPQFPSNVPTVAEATMPVGCYEDVNVTYNRSRNGVMEEVVTEAKQCCDGWTGDHCEVKPPDTTGPPDPCRPSDCDPVKPPRGRVYCLPHEICGTIVPRYYEEFTDEEIECRNTPSPPINCQGRCDPSPCGNCTGYAGSEQIVCFERGCDCRALWLVITESELIEIDCDTGLSVSEVRRLKRQSGDSTECSS